VGYTTQDFKRMESLKKKYPTGVKCDWCEYNKDCIYCKEPHRLPWHHCCDFKDSRLDFERKDG